MESHTHTHTHLEAEQGNTLNPTFWIFGVHGLGDMRWPVGYLVQVEGASLRQRWVPKVFCILEFEGREAHGTVAGAKRHWKGGRRDR